MALTINLEEHHNHYLLEVIGSIDAENAEIIAKAMDKVINDSHKHLLLDCTQLHSINSEGLKALMTARRLMSFFRMIIICNLSASVAALLEFSGIHHFIPLLPDIFEAETMLQELEYSQGHIAIDYVPQPGGER